MDLWKPSSMKTRLASAWLVQLGILLAGTDCSPAPSSASSAEEETFSLRVGESTTLEGVDLTLSFKAVTRDSRCPKDVTCIVAGEAVVVFEALSSGARAELVFDVPPGGGDTKEFEGFTISITGLEPQPESGKRIDASSYVASVTVRQEAS